MGSLKRKAIVIIGGLLFATVNAVLSAPAADYIHKQRKNSRKSDQKKEDHTVR